MCPRLAPSPRSWLLWCGQAAVCIVIVAGRSEQSWSSHPHGHLARHKLQKAHGTTAPQATSYSQLGEDTAANTRYFHGATSGVFLEMGALDGVRYSNTKYFEDGQQWRGLLIEPNPLEFKKLLHNRPNSTCINAAICNREQTVHYVAGEADEISPVAGIWEFMSPGFRQQFYAGDTGMPSYAVPITCVPLHTLLSQHGISHIDFFSLDVEGAELEVLKTFDFSQVSVHVWVIELDGHDAQKDEDVRKLLYSHGYVLDKHSKDMGMTINDWFIRKDNVREDGTLVELLED